VLDRSASVQKLPVEAGFWNGRDNIYVTGWEAHYLSGKAATNMEQALRSEKGSLGSWDCRRSVSGQFGT